MYLYLRNTERTKIHIFDHISTLNVIRHGKKVYCTSFLVILRLDRAKNEMYRKTETSQYFIFTGLWRQFASTTRLSFCLSFLNLISLRKQTSEGFF